MIVSHIHPSSPEGMELLSETLVPALQDSSFSSGPAASRSEGGRRGGEGEEEEEHREAFLWSVDVHCGGTDGDDDDGGGGSEGDSESDVSAGADEDGDGEGRAARGVEEKPGGGEDGDGDGDGDASGQVGPSAYMARKVGVKESVRRLFSPMECRISVACF